MTQRERFQRVMDFEPVDRLPVMEWAPWWDKTVARWRTEGLPEHLNGREIDDHFGLDSLASLSVGGATATTWTALQERDCLADMDSYRSFRDQHLFDAAPFETPEFRANLEALAERQAAGEVVIWMVLEGYFWFPRTLFGIERHLFSFYDSAEVMAAINTDLVAFQLKYLAAVNEVLAPDFMTFAEDMSYRSGPMCSKEHFDEFIGPNYRKILPVLQEAGTLTLVDTDGDCTDLVPWFLEVGMQGFLPLERQAGVDPAGLRASYPKLRMIGGYNKIVMNKGEDAIREEFERLMPAMRSGGYIPACDHQTPPGVSLEQYGQYLALLREYCQKAAE